MGIERLIGYQAHLSASVSFPPFIFFPLHRGLRLSIRGPTHAPCHVLSSQQQPLPSLSQTAGAVGDRSPRVREWLMEKLRKQIAAKGKFSFKVVFFFCWDERIPRNQPVSSLKMPPHHQQFVLEKGAMQFRSTSSVLSFHCSLPCFWTFSCLSSSSSGTTVFVDVALLRIQVAKHFS